MTESVLVKFHGALVEALRQRDPEGLTRPFTVAEIYQDLVPYGAYRDVLGVEMNGDYEHALLRLLAGEGEFLELESEHALREIRDELESVNPNTGLYREFAAVDVRLNPEFVPDPATIDVTLPDEGAPARPVTAGTGTEASDEDGDSGPSSWPEEGSTTGDDYIQVVPLGAFASSTPLDPEMVEPDVEPEPESLPLSVSGPSSDDEETACLWCREILPKRDNLNFCPYCGTDVRLVPCVSCGEALEPGWRFCIACGARAPEEV